jgi:hypothetical protein
MTDLLRELDQRSNGEASVVLLWRQRDGRLFVTVADEKSGESFRIEVRDGERPLDVFHHPYAYAAWHGVEANAGVAKEPATWRR